MPSIQHYHVSIIDTAINKQVYKKTIETDEFEVEYVSVLAQAQRLVNTGAIDRLAEYTAGLAQVWPEARHKFNAVQSVDDYADALGVDPATVNSDEVVEAMVQAEREQQAQAQAAAQAEQLTNMAKTASETEVSEDNALGTVMQRAGIG